MPNRLLLAASQSRALRHFITTRKFTRNVADRFVAGHTLDEAVAVGRSLKERGLGGLFDYLGENVATEAQADSAATAYIAALDAASRDLLDAHISVKLTQLGLESSVEGVLERMEKIAAKASEVGTIVAIDMEGHAHTQATIDCYQRLRSSHDNIVLCLQAYLRRSLADVEGLLPLKPSIRVCKGAYDEPREIAYGKHATRANFRRITATLLESTPYTAVATHDDSLIDHVRSVARGLGLSPDRYEFQMLYGVRRELQESLAAEGHRVRIYIPFGDEWYPYLMRRLAERPANLRFFLEALMRG